MSLRDYLSHSATPLNEMVQDKCLHDAVSQAIEVSLEALRKGLSILVCGNGGSAADAQHLTCELVGRFLCERKALSVICLSSNMATMTALGNDYGYPEVFSRQVEAYGQPGAVLIGLSTSGSSLNVIRACQVARHLKMTTIAFTGKTPGQLGKDADILITVPATHTPIIQQLHTCLYHYFCEQIEKDFSSH